MATRPQRKRLLDGLDDGRWRNPSSDEWLRLYDDAIGGDNGYCSNAGGVSFGELRQSVSNGLRIDYSARTFRRLYRPPVAAGAGVIS